MSFTVIFSSNTGGPLHGLGGLDTPKTPGSAAEEGVVPSDWKEANTIPLFKKGSRNKSGNYTSVICK